MSPVVSSFSDLVGAREDLEGLPPALSPSPSRRKADVPSTVEGAVVVVAVYLLATFLPEQ